MSKTVVVEYGILPNTDFNVLAYGKEAMQKARDENVINEGPIKWDGSVNYVAVGGSYAVIDSSTETETLRQIQLQHELDDYACQAITEDSDITELELMDI